MTFDDVHVQRRALESACQSLTAVWSSDLAYVCLVAHARKLLTLPQFRTEWPQEGALQFSKQVLKRIGGNRYAGS